MTVHAWHAVRAALIASAIAPGATAAAQPSESPPSPPAPREGRILELRIADEPRRALAVPGANPRQPAPALLYFHGRTGTAEGERALHRFEALWPEAIIVYAQGTAVDADGTGKDPEGKPAWTLRFPHKAALGQTKDIEYTRALLTRLGERYNVDRARVFAAGHSSGAFFVLSLAELMPDEFAAFAACSAYARYKVPSPPSLKNAESPALPLDATDRARRPRPVLYMFGEGDTVFNRDAGGGGLPGWSADGASLCRSTLAQLLVRNACPEPREAYWTGRDALRVEPNDDRGAAVEFRLHPGAHEWPRTAGHDADRWVVEFFQKTPARRP